MERLIYKGCTITIHSDSSWSVMETGDMGFSRSAAEARAEARASVDAYWDHPTKRTAGVTSRGRDIGKKF